MTSVVLDTHVHVFVPGIPYAWLGGRQLHEQGPDTPAIVIEGGVDAGHELEEARGIRELALSCSWVRGFVAPLALAGAGRDELGALLVGFRAAAGVRSLDAAGGLPVDLLSSRDTWGSALALAAGAETTVVLDHAGGDAGADGWLAFAEAAAGLPNTVVKLSARPSAEVVARALHLFGPDRAMFGSDRPVTAGPDEQVRLILGVLGALGCSEAESHAVLRGTAERVYGVSDRSAVR